MDNFGFIEYRPHSCKLATYAKQKIRFTFPGGYLPPPLAHACGRPWRLLPDRSRVGDVTLAVCVTTSMREDGACDV